MGVHRIVREDGQLLIARAFRPGEWKRILEQAGIETKGARIVRRFPFRLSVECATTHNTGAPLPGSHGIEHIPQ